MRIVPAQFVKPYVKPNKNDNVAAQSIAEAATRPNDAFVAVKRVDQIDVRALHQAHDMIVQSAKVCAYLRTAAGFTYTGFRCGDEAEDGSWR